MRIVTAAREWMGRALSFPVVLGAMIVGATYAMVLSFRVDPDFWWHLKTGELILATHRWQTVDSYSYTTAGTPWMSAEWLGDVLFALAWQWGGLRGLQALLVVLASLVTLSIYGLATLRSGSAKAAFVTVAVLLGLMRVSFNLRPQMIGYLFLILTLIALERFRQGRQRAVWLLPPLFLIWINAHGSWPIGLGAIAVFMAAGILPVPFEGLEVRRWTRPERVQLEIVFLLCLLVLPLTPYGAKLALYPFTVASSLPVSVAYIAEWQPLPFDDTTGQFFLVAFFGLVLAQLLFRFSWRPDEILLLFFGAVMACMHRRFLLLFIPFYAPVLATMLARWFRDGDYTLRGSRALINATIMTAVAGGMVLSFPARAAMESAVAEQFPVAALDHLRRNPAPAPLLNAYDFGGYMVWAGHDVFIDGRSELFEVAGVLADYVHITKLKPGALKVLANYGVRACLIHPDEPLATLLASQPDWHSVYSDARSTLFVKRQPAERAHPDPEVPRPVLEPPATEASRRRQSADAHQQ